MTEVIHRERSGRPDVDSQREPRPQQLVIGNDETELDLSVESRSFLNRVKWRQTFYDMGDVHDCNNGISSFMGRNHLTIVNPL